MDSKALLVGAALGAGIVYMLDPQTGRRRRALVRDKLVHASHTTRETLDATARDMANRSRGIVAATRGRLAHEEVPDERLRERVRSKLGRVCSHPRAVEVDVEDGHVTLRGPILAHEAPGVLRMVETVRGVRSVNDALDLHDSAEHVPALQGGGPVAGPTIDLLQRRWAPATQALVAAVGLAAAGFAMAAARRAA